MNFIVTLHGEDGGEGTVIVEEITYTNIGDGYYVKLEGTDPYCYPDFVQDEDLRWFSKNLTLILNENDPIEIDDISVTGESIPEPDVYL